MNNNIYTTPNYIPTQSSSIPIINQNYNYNESEYASNLLKKNVGKKVKIYVSFGDSLEWRDTIFEGIIEETGKDYILIYNQNTNRRYLLWNVYLDYIVFEEQVNREY